MTRLLVVAVLGPTAVGKSALAIALAQRFDGEIVNCDSTAVYRGFDIGTDKVAERNRGGIPHHLIDIVDPTEEYTAAHYARDAARAIREEARQKKIDFQLPVDHIVVEKIEPAARTETLGTSDPAIGDRMGVDIGPETIARYAVALSSLLVWGAYFALAGRGKAA